MRSIFPCILLLCIVAKSKSQAVTQPISARYLAVNAYSVNQADVYGARINPAAHAILPQSQVAVYSEHRYMLDNLNLYTFSLGINTHSGNFGVHGGYFGFAEQNQTQLSLSYGRKVSKVLDLGASFHYQQICQSGIYGSASAITGTLGMLLHLGDKVVAGLSAYNPFRAAWGKESEERLPSQYRFGLGYDASEKLFLGAEIVKEENQPVDVQAAIHYAFLKEFFVRAGIATQTSNAFAALGFKFEKFRIDLSASYHPQLGWSPGVLLLAQLGKTKNANSENP